MYATLNISATGIKLLSVKGRQVKKWGDAPLEPGLVRDGLILQPKAVGETISALFKSTRIPKERVITSLTGLSFTYRILSLPRMKPALLEEAILRGARKEIPLPLEELYLSWQLLGGKQDEQDFFILGVPRNLIDGMIQTLAEAGVEPYLMDLKPLALARAAHREDALIVDLEPDCFDIVLVVKGVPAIMHTVTPKGEGATLEDNIQRLADELLRTVKFYESSHPENPLSPTTPLLLTGELSAEAATSQLIQAEIEYPVEPLVPPLIFPSDLPIASYASNMGLALKKIPPKTISKGDAARFRDINLNVLSGKYRKARARPMGMRYMSLVAVFLIAIGLLFPVYQVKRQAEAETMRLQSELSGVSREFNQARRVSDEAKLVEAAINEITDDVETLKQEHRDILANGGNFANSLELVTDTLPAQAYFTSIEIAADRITVQGETDTPFTVINYVMALEAQGRFSEVRIIEIGEARPVETEVTGTEAADAGINVITFDIVISQ
jgi:type IV pilus assembly protein PilM